MYKRPSLDKILRGGNANHLPNSSSSFYQLDSEEALTQNLTTQPLDWYYRNKPITYKLNSLKYRTIEFDTVDWENSVVMFGCSMVFGVGLLEEDTIPSQLSNLLNRPVINLGVVASSTMFSFQNSLMLHENFPNPWGVVQLWTDPSRVSYFKKSKTGVTPVHCGSWMPDVPMFKAWIEPEGNIETQAYFAMKASEAIWKDKTRYCSASYWHYDDAIKLRYLDYARDLQHPGHISAKESAKIIAEALDSKS